MNSESFQVDLVDGADIDRRELLMVDPSVLGAIGLSHSLSSALADLIDNSLDAGASEICIRFLVENARVSGLQIRDNGAGMTASQLELAFGLAVKRDYQEGALGHFGMGLKSSSMSQAQVLTVFSSCGFEAPTARRLRRHDAGGDGHVEVLSKRAAWDGFDRGFDRKIIQNGTVVEWLGLDSVSSAHDDTDRRAWLGRIMIQIRQDLGLTFHRLLESAGVVIEIEQFDVELQRAGAPATVEPLSPFDFHISGMTGYPKPISASTASGARMTAVCHILPPNDQTPAAKLLGQRRAQWQGLYLYRNNRLIQGSGWHSLLSEASDLQLARVAIDLTDDLLSDVALSPDKNGVVLRPRFIDALETARDDDGEVGFRAFLDDARSVMQKANQRAAKVKPVTAVASGLPAPVLDAVEAELRHRDEARPIAIKWRQLEQGQVFWVDHVGRTLWLNAGYRQRLSGSSFGLQGDASLLKTTLFLLLEKYFAKERLVQSALEQIEAWNAVLSAAMAAQFDVSVIEADRPDTEDDAEADVPVVETDPESGIDADGDATSPTKTELDGVDWGTSVGVDGVDQKELAPDDEGLSAISGGDDDEFEFAAQLGLEHVMVSVDPMKDYRQRAAAVLLLTAEEEVTLARRIEAGVLALERNSTALDLTRAQRRELELVSRDGRRAQAHMVAANLRLVISIASRYQNHGLEFLDLIQEGNLGLLRAIEKFDYTLGNKFSTYATWWIRQGITRALADQGRTIRVPAHMVEQIQRVKKARRDLEDASASAASVDEIAARAEESPANVRKMLRYDQPPLSLDEMVMTGHLHDVPVWSPLGELLEDDEARTAEQHTSGGFLQAALNDALDLLDEREAGVIRMRFGLEDGVAKTLDQIGEAFGVTRERIRQIEVKVMTKLRHPSIAQQLREFMYDGDSIQEEGVAATSELRRVREEARRTRDQSESTAPNFHARPSPSNVIMPATVVWARRDRQRPEDDAVSSPFVDPPSEPDPHRAEPAGEDSRAIPDELKVDESEPELEESDPAPVAVSTSPQPPEVSHWWMKSEPALPVLLPTDTLLLEGFRTGKTIADIASEVSGEDRAVAVRLTELLFDVEGELDAADFAPRHGDPYEPDERARMIWEYGKDVSVERIAANFGRTILAVAWQLLDSPERPVDVPKRLRKAARRVRS